MSSGKVKRFLLRLR